MSNCFELLYISGSYLPIALIKKGLGSQDIQGWLCKNPTNVGNLDNIRPLKDKKVLR
jgi:hypothetical protein